MGILSKMRKQNAIYWPPAEADDFGKMSHGPLVELILIPGGKNYRVRWEERIDEFLDAKGTTALSSAVVYVPKLPDGSEIVVGGYLWLGDRSDLIDEAEPRNNPNAYEILRADTLPNFKASDYLRTAYL